MDLTSEKQVWGDIWETLLSSANLLRIGVIIFDRGFRIPETELLELLQALSVRGFTVQLPWKRGIPGRKTLDSD